MTTGSRRARVHRARMRRAPGRAEGRARYAWTTDSGDVDFADDGCCAVLPRRPARVPYQKTAKGTEGQRKARDTEEIMDLCISGFSLFLCIPTVVDQGIAPGFPAIR